MPKLSVYIVLITCCLISGVSLAGDSEKTPWLSKSAGIWKHEGIYGFYRVEVVRSGQKSNPTDTISINEFQYLKNKKQHKLVKRYSLPSIKHIGWIENIRFRMIDSQRMLLYLDIETDISEAASIRMVYMLSPGGRYELMQQADDMKAMPFK